MLYSQFIQEEKLSHKGLSVGAYNSGTMYLRKQKYSLAISDFDTAICFRPTHADAFKIVASPTVARAGMTGRLPIFLKC